MSSFYSIVRYVNNSFSRENIAIGLIAFTQKEINYRFSEKKIAFAATLNPAARAILEFAVSKLQSSLSNDSKNENLLFGSEGPFTKGYVERLSNYCNGIIQFDKPMYIDLSLSKELFDSFFMQFIDVAAQVPNKVQKESSIKKIIESEFYPALKNQIDVNFNIRKKQLPSLFFDYHLDGLGVNGAIYSIKAIDINSGQPIENLNKEIAEFESINGRLDKFGLDNGISKKNKHFLIVDEYKGNKKNFKELYQILSGNTDYKLVAPTKIQDVINLIKSKKAKKFSEKFSLS